LFTWWLVKELKLYQSSAYKNNFLILRIYVMTNLHSDISFSSSENSILNMSMLLEAMNEYEWTTGYGGWIRCGWMNPSNNSMWFIDHDGKRNPIVRPFEDTELLIQQDNGELIEIPAKSATPEDHEKVDEIIRGMIPLGNLSESISKHITAGWIEIACCDHDENGYPIFSSLRIYAEGKAEYKSSFFDERLDPASTNEVYEP
jgi:hypothetical protein